MSVLHRLFIALLIGAMAGCAATPEAPPAAESQEETSVDKSKWYPHIVDIDFVTPYAVIPRNESAMIIDSRPTGRKFDEGHIPGAYSIPDSQFDKMTNQLPEDKGSLLIFYCGGTKCMLSHKSAFKAEKLGYTHIKVYADGFPDWKKKGNVISVAIPHLKSLMESNAPMVIIDSRPKKRKYDAGHIPGAISIPDSNFDQMTASLPADKNTPLYFYCGGYKCKLSPNSAAKAQKLGYKNVHIVPEGYPGWKKANSAAAAPKVMGGKEKGSITLASFEDIMSKAPNSILVVDVRDADEFARGTIKGAVNLPINDLEKKMDTLPKNKDIVFMCGTGARAGEAYDMLQMFRPDLKAHFLNAEIDFKKGGGYTMKEPK